MEYKPFKDAIAVHLIKRSRTGDLENRLDLAVSRGISWNGWNFGFSSGLLRVAELEHCEIIKAELKHVKVNIEERTFQIRGYTDSECVDDEVKVKLFDDSYILY